MVARHYSLNANLLWSRDTDHKVEMSAMDKSTFEEDGTLEPVEVALLEISRHGRMNHIVDSQLVGLACQQKTRQDGFLQHALSIVHILAYQRAKTLLQRLVASHEPLGCRIAVVDTNAMSFQFATNKTLAAANASCYRYFHLFFPIIQDFFTLLLFQEFLLLLKFRE